MMEDHCLYCDAPLSQEMTWKRLFFPEPKRDLICQKCAGNLQRISGSRCRLCSRSLDELDLQFRVEDNCYDCVRWESDVRWKGALDFNFSLYEYNDFLKDVLAQFKFRGDYALVYLFAKTLTDYFQEETFDLVVPIPLSEERLLERGFNQSEALVRAGEQEPFVALNRRHSEKQSKKTRDERIKQENFFQLAVPNEAVQGKQILLVDDIYTTGTTLRHAAKVLKEAGAEVVRSFTLARG